MPSCDVIIPTYNNADVLPLTLPALFRQGVPNNWSVHWIISDDGSQDDTVKTIRQVSHHLKSPPRIITGAHSGPAGARNRALAVSTSSIVLFLGADIILRPGALSAHLDFHTAYPTNTAAALGVTKWDPKLPPTSLMEWMVHGGPQNSFDDLLGAYIADPQLYFYGANLSLKRDALYRGKQENDRLLNQQTEIFSTQYHGYGWEDIDLGRQLAGQGLRLHVLSGAVGLHHHRYSTAAICRRQRLVGRGIVVYQKRFPTHPILPDQPLLKTLKRKIGIALGLPYLMRWVTGKVEHKLSTPRLYAQLTGLWFWWGVYQGKKA